MFRTDGLPCLLCNDRKGSKGNTIIEFPRERKVIGNKVK